MAAETKSFRAVAIPLPPLTIRVHAAGISEALCRRLVWAQVIIAFLAVECGVWAARLSVRNRWAIAAGIIVVTFALVDRPSVRRLGLGLPNAMGSSLMLGVAAARQRTPEVGSVLILILLLIVICAAGGLGLRTR